MRDGEHILPFPNAVPTQTETPNSIEEPRGISGAAVKSSQLHPVSMTDSIG